VAGGNFTTHGIIPPGPLVDVVAPPSSPADGGWDAFWRLERGPGGWTNAERVARGVPALGPTFVKAAQIASTRPDVLPAPLADALGDLRDRVPPFDNLTAKRIIRDSIRRAMNRPGYESRHIRTKDDLKLFMASLTEQPVAAASVAQVYRGTLPGFGPVAVKVLRPGIRQKVERDATLFHSVATWVESWNNNTLKLLPLASSRPHDRPLGLLRLVQPVDEFTSRVLEDIDFVREVENIKAFSQLYDSRVGTSPTVNVVVPQPVTELCSERILVMEWLEGTKLTDVVASCGGDCDEDDDDEEEERGRVRQENLGLVIQAIECTISQLLDYGLVHGDPHSANLLKVYGSSHHGGVGGTHQSTKGEAQLGYLDFGLVSYVPQKFRDGIVCAVTQLIFARNIQAVADLCGDLELLDGRTLQDPKERGEFIDSVKGVLDEILIWPKDERGISTAVPRVRFERLLPAVTRLVRKYEFSVPPYFFQNVRALATLEGMGLSLDPDFNVLRVVYPYCINRLMRNPSVSAKVRDTFVDICRSPHTTLLSPRRVRMLLNDWAMWTGHRKRRVLWALVTSAGGRRVAPAILHNWSLNRIRDATTAVRWLAGTFLLPWRILLHTPQHGWDGSGLVTSSRGVGGDW
jgi:aarF domain-containing kinase